MYLRPSTRRRLPVLANAIVLFATALIVLTPKMDLWAGSIAPNLFFAWT